MKYRSIILKMNVNNYNKIRHIDESLKEAYDIKDSKIRTYNGRHINIKPEKLRQWSRAYMIF